MKRLIGTLKVDSIKDIEFGLDIFQRGTGVHELRCRFTRHMIILIKHTFVKRSIVDMLFFILNK